MSASMFGLSKNEILRHKQSVSNIFTSQQSVKINAFPIKFILVESPIVRDQGLKVLFTVPAKSIRKSVERNLIRRRMKEAFRLQKNVIKTYLPASISKDLGILYIAKEPLSYDQIAKAFNKFSNEISKMDF